MMGKIKEWLRGYSKTDVDSAIIKWGAGLLSKTPYIKVTPQEMRAIRKCGICISLSRGILVRHVYLEKGAT